MVHISHRGGSMQALQNTLPAFKKAIQNGTDIIQLDVYLTKDGQIVVHHDQNFERVWGDYHRIKDVLKDELPNKPLQSIRVHFNKNCYYPNQQQLSGLIRPPLLRQVFVQFPKTIINMELKDQSYQTVQKVSYLIEQFQRQQYTIWGIKDYELAKQMKIKQPAIPLFFTPRSGIIAFCCCCCCLPCISFQQQIVEFPMVSNFVQRWIPYEQRSCIIKCLLCLVPIIRACLICVFWHLKKRGHPIFLWTLNSNQQFVQAIEQYADGIMTDRPSYLKQFIISQGL